MATTQIFDLAMIHGVVISGIATVEDHRVTTICVDSPPYARLTINPLSPGRLSAHQAIALGQILVQFGEAMLTGELKHDANAR